MLAESACGVKPGRSTRIEGGGHLFQDATCGRNWIRGAGDSAADHEVVGTGAQGPGWRGYPRLIIWAPGFVIAHGPRSPRWCRAHAGNDYQKPATAGAPNCGCLLRGRDHPIETSFLREPGELDGTRGGAPGDTDAVDLFRIQAGQQGYAKEFRAVPLSLERPPRSLHHVHAAQGMNRHHAHPGQAGRGYHSPFNAIWDIVEL